LTERTWQCETCGSKHDRDINASVNISVEGQNILEQKLLQGFFENQEKPCKSRYGKKKKDSTLESGNKSAGLAERGETVSRREISASFVEARQEKH
jgi:hypothetical protein